MGDGRVGTAMASTKISSLTARRAYSGLYSLTHNVARVAMFMYRLAFFWIVACTGCAGPTFLDFGNGTAVPASSIDQRAEADGISRKEAGWRLREESELRRLRDGGY